MNTRRLITGITFLAVFAMAARISMDTDTWWHLRAGEWILANGRIPQVDPFSYTRLGAAWQYPGWLVQVPMALIYRAFGPGGLNLWTAGMVTLAFSFLWRALSGGPFLKAFVVVLAASVSGVYWAARPYLVTFLIAAIFLWILEDQRWRPSPQSARRLWALPILMVLWANSHGGFAVGFLLWGVYLAGDVWGKLKALSTQQAAIRNPQSAGPHPSSSVLRLLIIGALLFLAVCLNPSGPVMLLYPFKTVGIGALQEYIQEWQSPDFHSLSVQPFIWLLLLTFGAVGASRRRLALTDFLLAAGFAYLGLLAGRNLALFALAAPLALSRHTAPLLEAAARSLGFRSGGSQPPGRRQSAFNWSVLMLLALAVLAKLSLVVPYEANRKAWSETLPLEAVDWIERNRPPGRLFNPYNWGGYLLWALPEYPVFVDGRTDLYDDEVIGQWLAVVRAEPGWQAILDEYAVNLVLTEPGSDLDRELGRDPLWDNRFEDPVSVVYRRKSPIDLSN
jgi:hypothetical protein